MAREWLSLPTNANGRTNADVLAPWWNGEDLVGRARDNWIINFGERKEEEAAYYEAPFKHAKAEVEPARRNSAPMERDKWWLLARRAPAMFAALAPLTRFIITPEVSKHRIFAWNRAPLVPDKNLVAIARDDDVSFGILQGRLHTVWALKLGTSLEDRPRYTSTTTFRSFPFPEGLTPNIPAADYANDPRAIAIAKAAKELNEKREAWLNPPEWTERVPEVVPGYPDRIVAKPGHEAELKKRTLTNLYNERPTWLDNLHKALDAAVAAAYGWPADLGDEQILERLFALNQERAAAGR